VLEAGSSLPPILVGHIRTMTLKKNPIQPNKIIVEDSKKEDVIQAP
jgi:hypothetical protein